MLEQAGLPLVSDQVTGIAAGAAVDGWDVTSGTTADPAWGGTGAASKIALLKSIAGGTGGTDPASPAVANQGTGSRGWLATIAGLLSLGTQTKAKSASVTPASDLANIEPAGTPPSGVTMPSGGSGVTGWLGAIANALAGKLGVKAAAGDLVDGSLVTLGSTTDAPASAALTAAATSLMSAIKGQFNLFQGGTAKLNSATVWLEGTAAMTITAGGQNFNGVQRAALTYGAPSNVAYFTAKVTLSASGQFFISNGIYNEYFNASANTPIAVKVPITGTSMSAGIIAPASGGSNLTATLHTMLSAA